MADVASDLIDELRLAGAVVALVDDRIYGDTVPPGVALPFVWLQRRGVLDLGTLEAESEPWGELFDLECVADTGSGAVALADAVRAALNGARGLLGSNVYSAVAVRDAADDYVPRNVQAAEYLFITTLDIEVNRP